MKDAVQQMIIAQQSATGGIPAYPTIRFKKKIELWAGGKAYVRSLKYNEIKWTLSLAIL